MNELLFQIFILSCFLNFENNYGLLNFVNMFTEISSKECIGLPDKSKLQLHYYVIIYYLIQWCHVIKTTNFTLYPTFSGSYLFICSIASDTDYKVVAPYQKGRIRSTRIFGNILTKASKSARSNV